ncbi:MAG: O-sialoglycoprotein endopeptidase [Bacillota bacterium]
MILGIDTSCYTTSLAIVDYNGVALADCRQLLQVPDGACGLAQSQALFLHLAQFPQLLQQVYQIVDNKKIKGICASTRPRPVEGSYMPVFRVGGSIARMLADTLNVPFAATSHQEGHLQAALWSLDKPLDEEEFLALHLSGGTGEVLHVKRQKGAFAITIIGDSDLAAGQYIDRIGVAMGLPFPAGSHLEKLARQATGPPIKLPVSVKENHIYFNGPQSAAKRLLDQGEDFNRLAWAVLINIADSLAQAMIFISRQSGIKKVLLAGGVMANSIIKERLLTQLNDHAELYFARADYAGDNAVGVALLGRDIIHK